MLSMLDEAIADLRAVRRRRRFDLTLAAFVELPADSPSRCCRRRRRRKRSSRRCWPRALVRVAGRADVAAGRGARQPRSRRGRRCRPTGRRTTRAETKAAIDVEARARSCLSGADGSGCSRSRIGGRRRRTCAASSSCSQRIPSATWRWAQASGRGERARGVRRGRARRRAPGCGWRAIAGRCARRFSASTASRSPRRSSCSRG